ncbi:MAG: ribosome-associated translation inhibitor RaiA [Clostridia bacterium]|nr:ribosome-associated translation inhibitor RaiA [Clostridia bacterium]
MKITIVARQITVFDEWKVLAEKKLQKLSKFFEEQTNATVTFSKHKNNFTVEITIFSAGTVFRCENTAGDFREAIDRSVEVIERQIRRNKTRLEKRLRTAAFVELPPAEDVEEEKEFTIRRKSFPVTPMSPEEAILQMNLSDHSFFIFEDESSGDICVVYKRKDDTYGLIVPLHE